MRIPGTCKSTIRGIAVVLALRSRLAVVLLMAPLLQACAATTEGDSGIYVVEPGNGVPGWIGAPAGTPVWAPDGESIAWGSEDGLFRRDLTSAASVVLSENPVTGRPAWAPDGSAIAFVDRERQSLIVLDAQTEVVRFSAPVETDDAVHDPLALPVLGGPAWSPDGARLAFTCWDGAGDEICVIGADGSNNQQVTHIERRRVAGNLPADGRVPAVSNTGPPAWSPDGTTLAIAVYPEQRGAAAGVFVVDLERGRARRVSSLLPNSEIIWFADGASLLFSATETGRSDVLRIWLETRDVENLTDRLADGARDPAMSTDGSKLAVASGGAIVVQDFAGNVEASFTSRFQQRLPAWRPLGEGIAYAAAQDPLLNYS